MKTEMENQLPSRHVKKKKKKHYPWIVLFIAIMFLVGGGSAAAYLAHSVDPKNHFEHLHTVGNSENARSDYKEKSGTFNVLLFGSDARKGEKGPSHTDSILLVHADLTQHRYNVLSIPRDTRVYMDGYGYTKLTSVQFVSQIKNGPKRGITDAVTAVSNLFGVPINYYAETNYWGLQDMVDSIGGIKMKIPFNVTLTHPWNPKNKNKVFRKGVYQLDGTLVAEIVHERDSLPRTDYGRQQLQKNALIGIANKVMQPQNMARIPALSRSLSKFLISTNLSTNDMISLGLGIKGDYHPAKQIHYYQIPGKNVVMPDDVLKANNAEVVLDPAQMKRVIHKYFVN